MRGISVENSPSSDLGALTLQSSSSEHVERAETKFPVPTFCRTRRYLDGWYFCETALNCSLLSSVPISAPPLNLLDLWNLEPLEEALAFIFYTCKER